MILRMRNLSIGACKEFQRFKNWGSRVVLHVRSSIWQMVRGPSEGWITFILLLLSVMLVAWSVGSSIWLPGGFYSLVLCSVVLGLVFAKMRFSGWLLMTGGLLTGCALSLGRLAGQVEGVTRLDRLSEVIGRLYLGWQTFVAGGATTDILPFSFVLLSTSWSLGFLSAWFLFRKHSVFGALLPSGIAVAASLTILTSQNQMAHLYMYLIVGVLLTARLFNLERHREWNLRGVQRYPRGSKPGLHEAFLLVVAAVLVTSLLPVRPEGLAGMAAAWTSVSYPVRVFEEKFARLVGGLPVNQPYSGYFFGPTYSFGGSATHGQAPVLKIEAPFPIYLRARSYDLYMSDGWTTSDTSLVFPEQLQHQGVEEMFESLVEVEVTVTTLLSLRQGEPVYLGGYPVEMSVDYRLEILEPARYRILVAESWSEASTDGDVLPPDLQQAVERLNALRGASGGRLTNSEIESVLPDDVRLVSWEYDGEGVEAVIVERRVPIQPQTASVRIAEPLGAGDQYWARAQVSMATETELRAAATVYPGWILDRYLQLPDTVSSRVVELAQELTAGAETPYEKAVAIRDYLRTIDYALDIEAPPHVSCGVDYFLFELNKGYCQYFASAMAVLLRVSGVPSRIAVGYGSGEMVDARLPHDVSELPRPDGIDWHVIDEPLNARPVYMVSDTHSWCEVFFPGYGWIIFEPTPSYPVVARIGPSVPATGDIYEGVDAVPGEGEAAGPLPGAEYDTGGLPGADGHDEAITLLHLRPTSILVALAVLGMLIWLVWRRLLGRVSEPRVAYSRIGRLAALSRLAPQASLTPYEYGRRLSAAMPDVSAELNSLVDAYVRVCYGGCRVTADDGSRVAEAWPRVRDGLLRRAIRGLLPRRFW